MNICAECHRMGTGCCYMKSGDEAFRFGLTLPEMERIVAYTQTHFLDFADVDYIDEKVLSDWITYLHPLFRDIFPNNIRFALKTVNDQCIFLTAEGCKLPVGVRPHYCRLYPFFVTPFAMISILRSPTCLAQKDFDSLGPLLEKLGMTKTLISTLHKNLVHDAEEHNLRKVEVLAMASAYLNKNNQSLL